MHPHSILQGYRLALFACCRLLSRHHQAAEDSCEQGAEEHHADAHPQHQSRTAGTQQHGYEEDTQHGADFAQAGGQTRTLAAVADGVNLTRQHKRIQERAGVEEELKDERRMTLL